MPTEQQKKAFNEYMKTKQKGEILNMGEIMRKAGYSKEMSRNPQVLANSKGFKQLLAQYEDEPLMDRLYAIALQGSERNSIEAVKEVFKLKDRYPIKGIKVGKLDEEQAEIEDDITEEAPEQNKVEAPQKPAKGS